MTYRLITVTTDDEWQSYHAIRRSVLWEARGHTTYDAKHPDEYLPNHYPLLLLGNDRPLGTLHLDDSGDGTGIIRLVAIAGSAQRQGHGTKLAALAEEFARGLGLHTLFVNAAPEALEYYQKLGWKLYDWNKAELIGKTADCLQMTKRL